MLVYQRVSPPKSGQKKSPKSIQVVQVVQVSTHDVKALSIDWTNQCRWICSPRCPVGFETDIKIFSEHLLSLGVVME